MSKKRLYLLQSSILFTIPFTGFAEKNEIIPAKPSTQVLLPIPSPSTEVTSSQPQPVFSETKMEVNFQSFTGRIIANRVRMRTAPSLDGFVVKETNHGELYAITGEENEFFAVQPQRGIKGYVFRTFILDNVVEGERVNIRLSPDIEAPIVGKLKAGEKINASVSTENSKWLEIELPNTSRFYIAKEYIEKVGGIDLFEKAEARRQEASQQLTAALYYARSEIQKPFEEIDLDGVHQKFNKITASFADFSEIAEKAKEAVSMIQETYIQKKIAFLETKADRTTASLNVQQDNLKKLADMSKELGREDEGEESIVDSEAITDKMLIWKPLEESRFHIWAMVNQGKTLDDLYEEEKTNADLLTGILEAYNRPVKNRPGDFLLKMNNRPIAFLYSTKVNLEELVGKKITVLAAPRSNNNFAFPAYFVFSIE